MEILRVPKLNENMDAAMVGPWAKKVGDPVLADDVVVELVTDKASFELLAGQSGVLRVAAAPERSTLPVGYAIAVIAGPDEEIPDVRGENAALMNSYAESIRVEVSAAPRQRIKATPAARKAAKERGVDLAEVAAALGIDGVVEKSDVERFIPS